MRHLCSSLGADDLHLAIHTAHEALAVRENRSEPLAPQAPLKRAHLQYTLKISRTPHTVGFGDFRNPRLSGNVAKFAKENPYT